jgi:protein-S-isoprenylcysteine O-methyltransferase Ste14
MWVISWSVLVTCWFAWMYPFLFRAPHRQNRDSITVAAPTRIGLALESVAIVLAFLFRLPVESPPGLVRQAIGMIVGPASAVMAWHAVKHLGRQFRLHAGLYVDHQLVRSGPYAIVRHPIYSSLFGMLLCSILMLTEWKWALISVALFVAGTEIRVRSEDGLLESRFGDEFHDWKRRVPAYIPFLR